MIFLVFFCLVLPFCVEESALSMTRFRRNPLPSPLEHANITPADTTEENINAENSTITEYSITDETIADESPEYKFPDTSLSTDTTEENINAENSTITENSITDETIADVSGTTEAATESYESTSPTNSENNTETGGNDTVTTATLPAVFTDNYTTEVFTSENETTTDLEDIDSTSDASTNTEVSSSDIPTSPTTTEVTTTSTATTEVTTTSTSTTEVTTTSTATTEVTTTSTITEPSTSLSTEIPETTSLGETGGSGDSGVKVGLVIGIIIAILLIGVGIVLWRAHRSGRRLWPPKNLFSNGPSDSVRPQLVPLKKFPAHCSEMLDVPSKLSHEYQLLATLSVDIYSTESCVAGQLPDNKCKNRYVNILPYDSTRVKLAPEGEDFYSDYVNASYIKGYTNEIEYIATQGPKEETCKDFWKMVYQEPIKVIIMVTQLEELGKPKCYRYYPKLRENMELEDIVVRCSTELHFPIYTSRTLILTKGERKRSITHLHFREWPDFGCPATPDLMLQFCQVMRHNIILAQPGITLIHCSAGVGRTGTLIAVDILLQHIKENKKIDIFGTVYKLRKHRMNMVQSEAQYVYIYKCIKEALEDPSYLSSENSSTTSLEPIYENIECARLSTVSDKAVPDTIISENECAL